MRPWLALSAFALAATASPAFAAESVLNGGVVRIQLYVPEDNGENGKAQSMDDADYVEVNPGNDPVPSELERYFNAARCECDRKAPGDPAAMTSQLFMLKLSFVQGTQPDSLGDDLLQVHAGANCEQIDTNPEAVTRNCSQLGPDLQADDLQDNTELIFAQAGDLLAPGENAEMPNACDPGKQSSDIIVTSGTSSRYIESGTTAYTVPFDLRAPEMPADVSATGLEDAIRITWDAPTTAPDYYQALCAKANGAPAHSLTDGATANATHSPKFDTVAYVCGATPEPPTVATLDGDDTAAGELPAALAALDRSYVCGQSEGTTSSIDLRDLDNDTSYWIVVLAIDKAGNYQARYLPRTIQPVPSIDFWEDVNAENPAVDGGFCVAQVSRGGSASSALLVLAAIAFAARRRRSARIARAARGAGLAALAALALAPGVARAQSWDPYWVEGGADATWQPPAPEWRLGLRVGPYYPAVDKGFTSDPGPYRRMFGPGYNLVPQLDLHRLWQLSGVQLGFGMSGGYYAKSAEAYLVGTSPDDPMRPRSAGATNTFKMIPLSATGVARLTVLDDRWRVPLVPYVRGGVAYNVWWVRTATGELAMTDCETCDDKALGASAGLVGAVGISIRGERIDPDAMASMRNGGVEHAGFYAELETSWVDGFGNEARLSLGDTTWYAGLDFEF